MSAVQYQVFCCMILGMIQSSDKVLFFFNKKQVWTLDRHIDPKESLRCFDGFVAGKQETEYENSEEDNINDLKVGNLYVLSSVTPFRI